MEIDAYDKLVRARKDPRESFSNVVRRAVWLDQPATAGDILAGLQSDAKLHPAMLLDEAALDGMDRRTAEIREQSPWAE